MRKKKKKRRYVTYRAQAKKRPRLSMRFIAKWSVFAFILIVTAVAYVWQQNTKITLGYRINELERNILAAGNEELKLRAKLVRLQRPDWLSEEVNARALGLQTISPKQRLTLATPRPLELPPAKREAARYPHAAPRTVGKVAGPGFRPGAPAPHGESSVLKQRR